MCTTTTTIQGFCVYQKGDVSVILCNIPYLPDVRLLLFSNVGIQNCTRCFGNGMCVGHWVRACLIGPCIASCFPSVVCVCGTPGGGQSADVNSPKCNVAYRHGNTA
jgi:hypothetical protein